MLAPLAAATTELVSLLQDGKEEGLDLDAGCGEAEVGGFNFGCFGGHADVGGFDFDDFGGDADGHIVDDDFDGQALCTEDLQSFGIVHDHDARGHCDDHVVARLLDSLDHIRGVDGPLEASQ
jgi:hypothetical protein